MARPGGFAICLIQRFWHMAFDRQPLCPFDVVQKCCRNQHGSGASFFGGEVNLRSDGFDVHFGVGPHFENHPKGGYGLLHTSLCMAPIIQTFSSLGCPPDDPTPAGSFEATCGKCAGYDDDVGPHAAYVPDMVSMPPAGCSPIAID